MQDANHKENQAKQVSQNSKQHTEQTHSDKIRRIFYFTAGLLTSCITLILTPGKPHLYITVFSVIVGFCYIALALIYRFSKIELTQLHKVSFTVILIQYAVTILELFIEQHTLNSFVAEATNSLLILLLVIVASFILYPSKQAAIVSMVTAIVTGIALMLRTALFQIDIRLAAFTSLLEPLFYIAIGIYLVRALALFQSDAQNAQSQASHYEKLAFNDTLTNIANRRSISEILKKEIEASKRYKTPLSIVLFDIDHFKNVNDTYGHNVGDQVLKLIANHVVKTIRGSDSVGRWGGEEFLCVLPNASAETAYNTAERLRKNIEVLEIEAGPKITASFGIAQYIPQDNFDSFINRADQELYNAKEQGRNCCLPIYSAESQDSSTAESKSLHKQIN